MPNATKPGTPAQSPAKTAAAETDNAPAPKKGKKKLIILVLILLLGSGAAAYLLTKQSAPAKSGGEADEAHSSTPASFVELGTFTANLIQEEGDRYLQVTISLKLTKPGLEEKIKANNPEILHRVNMLLQSKRPSELATIAGKEKLAGEIKAQVEYVLGLRKTAPVIGEDADVITLVTGGQSPQSASAAFQTATAASTPSPLKSGISDVLFTSFIVQ